MYRHIYDWKIIECDVKQQIHLTSLHMLLNIVLSIRRLHFDALSIWKYFPRTLIIEPNIKIVGFSNVLGQAPTWDQPF